MSVVDHKAVDNICFSNSSCAVSTVGNIDSDDNVCNTYSNCVVSKVIAMSPCLGPVTRLMTRGLYALLSTRSLWSQALPISAQAQWEMCFWS